MYTQVLSLLETEIAIKEIKDSFEKFLAKRLNLTRVSAPLMVLKSTGLNDDLSGSERQIIFDFKDGQVGTIVHSLAKWKRLALKNYGIESGGLYTDMNAIRRDEILSNIHSYYVDQWDWEAVIKEEERNMETLKMYVTNIYESLKDTQMMLNCKYSHLKNKLPENIYFVTSQELEDEFPGISSKERENIISKRHGAVFISQIGGKLKSGSIHDMRAPDYDDWDINGDIIVYNEILGMGFELSSMGVRVDSKSLERQLKIANAEDRKQFSFHQMILNNKLPFTIGGGLGQSRICMFLLEKYHIGEVQSSIWGDEIVKECEKLNINLL